MTEQNNIIQQDLYNRINKIPIVKTLGFDFLKIGKGVCAAIVKYDKKYDGIFESFHGGLLMTIADSVSAFAILTLSGSDAVITTTDMNIRFLAPCRSDVKAIATVIKHGRTMAPVAVDLFDDKGIKVAIAQVNYMILRRKLHK